MTHKYLVEIGYKWCLSRCGFAFKELSCINAEIADVIGFNSNGTFLIEAKVSRADFLKDKKKPFRCNPCIGMGDWRFFIAPKGLIKIEELPDMWGLIEVNEKGKALTVHNPFGKDKLSRTRTNKISSIIFILITETHNTKPKKQTKLEL
jgi:hypothetical protein